MHPSGGDCATLLASGAREVGERKDPAGATEINIAGLCPSLVTQWMREMLGGDRVAAVPACLRAELPIFSAV